MNTAGYQVQFAALAAEGALPAAPGALLTWEGRKVVIRGLTVSDALRGAANYVVTEVEAKRIEELQRRGALHCALLLELGRVHGH